MAKNTFVGLKELRTNLEKYVREVGRGSSFTVMRRSKPVFRIAPIDEEGEGAWETVVDFTKIDKRGVPADQVLKALRALGKK